MEAITPINKILMELIAPKRKSTKSERKFNEVEFKKSLITRYNCTNPNNPTLLKCMVLNHYFSADTVIAAHVIGLESRVTLSALNLSQRDLWSERNGLLIYKDIEEKLGAQDIVSIKVL